jgi:penicillin-binding protein 1A
MIRTLIFFLVALFLLVGGAAGGAVYVFYKYGQGLPDYRQLANYEPPVMTRVQAADGRLLAEYAVEKRIFVPIGAMPKLVTQAFLSAEDKNFYYHPGIDPLGIVRAALANVKNVASGHRLVGASTVTQQVAKNMLLTADVTLERKIKEVILAFRIERVLSKDRILELYLNEIYLGFGSYGVAAAALNYFDKSLDQLTVGEAAFLAALPKAPNNYNPLRRSDEAKARRDWVIGRMLEDDVIDEATANAALAEPFNIRTRQEDQFVEAPYFAEEVRRELAQRYGEQQLYKGGLYVRTSLDPKLQEIGKRVLREGLVSYDQRHGWKGPIAHFANLGADWKATLANVKSPPGLTPWRLAIVRELTPAAALVGIDDGTEGQIPLAEMKWARKWLEGEKRGPAVSKPTDALQVGNVVAVERVASDSQGNALPPNTYALRQIPEIEGSLVAMDPHTGRVLAMVGGYAWDLSQFNRASQAQRQPGSAFKPFVYMTALDDGFTPSSLILDAPFVIDQGPGLPKWRPDNYSRTFYGPSTMRLGVEKSRNLMTVRLAQTVGMDKIADTAKRFGVVDKMPEQLSMALGAADTTLMKLTAAYGEIVNGGKRITPTLIDRVQDRHGKTVFRHETRTCPQCQTDYWTEGMRAPELPDVREVVEDPATAYQMVSILEGVVQRGTGITIKQLNRPLAGKTGTSNDEQDTWFIGFSPDLVLGVFVGFDQPRSLGEGEQGATAAAPVFREFMRAALKDKPATPFRIPPGIRLVRVNAETGLPARPGERNVILEAFKPGTVPTERSSVVEGNGEAPTASSSTLIPTIAAPTTAAAGTGGLY